MVIKLKNNVLLGSLAASMLLGTNVFASSAGIHVDQVGYLSKYDKVAMVSGNMKENEFSVKDAWTDEVVYSGVLTAPADDAMSGEKVRKADFSAVRKPGLYKITVGNEESYNFQIGDNVYYIPALQNWRSYTLTRSGDYIKDDLTGLEVMHGHPQDKNAEMFYSDDYYNKGEIMDMSGGWYDAGDYGKYTTTAIVATTQMMMAYEEHPELIASLEFFPPDSVKKDAGLPDAINELKYELDFMKKMQRKDGSVFHKVSGANWLKGEYTPDTDAQPRYIYGNSSACSAMYGAAMAMAARVFANYDKAYADDCQERAEKVWTYLEQHPDTYFRLDDKQDSGSGPYDDYDDANERCWLAAELFKNTRNPKYQQYLMDKKDIMCSKSTFFVWNDAKALAQFTYIMDGAADKEYKAKVKNGFMEYADEVLQDINKDGFNCSLLKNEYVWGSSKNALLKGAVLIMANQIEPKPEYVEGALSQIHYAFGRNVLNRSYMTGVGSNPPQKHLSYIRQSTGAYIPGLLVGGPNCSFGDALQQKMLKEQNPPPAKCYIDSGLSYSTNEYAIDYTSAALYDLSWFIAKEKVEAKDLKLYGPYAKKDKRGI